MRAALGLATLFFAPSAYGFELSTTSTGATIHLRGERFEYFLRSDDPPALRSKVRLAVDPWSLRERSELRAEYRGLVETASTGDGRSVVSVSDWSGLPEPDATVALTLLAYVPGAALISEADILLNGARFHFDEAPGSYDAFSVVLHEAGHALGLAHSCGDAGTSHPSCFDLAPADLGLLDSVMAPSLAPSSRYASLTADDLAGLEALYPRATARDATVRSIDLGEVACEGTSAAGPSLTGPFADPALRVFIRTDDPMETELPRVDAARFGPFTNVPAIAEYRIVGLDESFVSGPVPRCPGVEPVPPSGCDCSTSTSGSLVSIVALLWAVARSRSRRAALLFVALVLGAEAPALAYKCSRTSPTAGPSLVWNIRIVPYVVDTRLSADIADRDALLAEIKASYSAWTDADCSDLEFSFEGLVSNAKAGFDPELPSQNLVTFVPSSWPYDPAIIAVTTNAFDSQTGLIFDSDIELNDQHFEFVIANENGTGCKSSTGQMDLRNSLTHEVGHTLGLDHPPPTRTYARTTMFASAPSCETQKRTLEADDLAGLCFIYPTGQATRACYAATGPAFQVVDADDGFGCGATKSRGSIAWLLGIFGILGISRAARRRSPRSSSARARSA